MKEKGRKTISKQIICIITVIVLCNFIMPNYIYAADTENGGKVFSPIMKLITFLCDSLMQVLQNTFTSNQSIANGDGTYNYQYSPAIIFSGTVQGLDINFITPNTDVRNTNNYEAFLRDETTLKMYASNAHLGLDSKITSEEYKTNYNKYIELKEKIENDAKYQSVLITKSGKKNHNYEEKIIYYYEEDNKLYVTYMHELREEDGVTSTNYYETYHEITADFLKQLNSTVTYTSIANELQPTIVTWYNALRRIALVGLLSVLVYLGIRILLSSATGEGNSKYKKMLTDWLVALCLLFTLHYIMSAVLIITQKLSSIFNVGITDEILNTLRKNIDDCTDWGEAFSHVIMYVVLVIYTFSFTWQYLKRVVYMAFFTMIAPLITLTYPLDKIKDSKAQAFTMWIREYVFNALIQVVHLIVYYVLIGSAVELAVKFPLYAIIAIGFMKIGEQTIRNMFGFNNAETVGTLQAVATGGLITKGLEKLKKMPFGGKKGNGSTEKSGEGTSGKVRTATNNPMGGAKNGVDKNSSRSGAEALIRKYGKTAMGGAIGVGTGIAGGIIGAAAGIAQGDVTTALTGAVAGTSAGNSLGKGAVNGIANTVDGVKNTARDVKDTYRAGKYGEETAQAMRFDEDFRKGSTYRALQSNPNFSDASVQAMLNAGITDKKEMTKILDSGMDVGNAIKYSNLAKKCPEDVLYDKQSLKTFCKAMKTLDSSLADQSYGKIRDNIRKFK